LIKKKSRESGTRGLQEPLIKVPKRDLRLSPRVTKRPATSEESIKRKKTQRADPPKAKDGDRHRK